MDPFSFAPISALLDLTYGVVEGLASLFAPIAGTASAAVAIIVLTLLVRAALIPLDISQVKSDWARRRLAPQVQALQRRYKKNPQLAMQKVSALYKEAGTSQFAGLLPVLAQAPVLSLLYAVFIRTEVGGHTNGLLHETLFGVPLGQSFVHLVTVGGWSGAFVYLGLFLVMGVVAWFSRRVALGLTIPNPDAPPMTESINRVVSFMPFITIVFAAFVPLAAALYLVTTTAWTLVERAVLRRIYWREAGGSTQAVARTA